jgi:hypothetical protein
MATSAKDNPPLRSTESSIQQPQFDFATDPAFSSVDMDQADQQFYIERQREAIERSGGQTYDMREPCPYCGCPLGVLRVRKNQTPFRALCASDIATTLRRRRQASVLEVCRPFASP